MHIFHEAGWPIYLVVAMGAISVIQAGRFAASGRRELLAGVFGYGAATLLFGLLGTVIGLQYSCLGLQQLPDPAAQHWIVFVGLYESLHNLDAALIFGIVDALCLVAGAGKRLAHPSASVAVSAASAPGAA